jgi:hypothetical protein
MHFTQIALALVAVPALVMASPAPARERDAKTLVARVDWANEGVRTSCEH